MAATQCCSRLFNSLSVEVFGSDLYNIDMSASTRREFLSYLAGVIDSDGSGNPQTYIYDGSVWVDLQETSNVISVNSQTGDVNLDQKFAEKKYLKVLQGYRTTRVLPISVD